MFNALKNMAFNVGLATGGAMVAGNLASKPKSGSYGSSFDFAPALAGLAGAVIAPAAYHLVAPVARSIAENGGVVGALRTVPASLGKVAFFGGASLLGAVVGGSLTSSSQHGDYAFGVDALPGMFLGSLLAVGLAGYAKSI